MSARSARPFPLIPRRRFAGVQIGTRRSPRRGGGNEVAGTRPYRPGDRRAWIDWRASAKLSAARGGDEFVVRQFFAEQAPRVVLVADRRPGLRLYGPGFPWLDKAAALDESLRLIAASTAAERGELAYVDHVGDRSFWLPPQSPARTLQLLAGRPTGLAGVSTRSLLGCLETVARHGSVFPHGTFVFVLSDFLDPPPARAWVRLRALGWDVTPVVIQDPTWERSFPDIGGVVLPVQDPATGAVGDVWIGRGEARRRAAANERRFAGLLRGFARLGFDPVVVESAEVDAITARFGRWAERRRRLRRGRP